MLRLIVLLSSLIFLINAQVNPASTSPTLTQTPLQSSLSSTSSLATSVTAPSTSSTTSLTSKIPTTATHTTPTTTLLQGPVGQPAPTTGTPGGPTPYTYSTLVNGVTQVLSDVFTPTSPPTVSVTPTVVGTILNYSSWLAVYSPTHTSSAGARCSLPSIPFSFILMMLLGILGGCGLVFV